jgi:hypothetical protein
MAAASSNRSPGRPHTSNSARLQQAERNPSAEPKYLYLHDITSFKSNIFWSAAGQPIAAEAGSA